jgi:hypothetical protein
MKVLKKSAYKNKPNILLSTGAYCPKVALSSSSARHHSRRRTSYRVGPHRRRPGTYLTPRTTGASGAKAEGDGRAGGIDNTACWIRTAAATAACAGRARLGLVSYESILLHQGVGSWRAATPHRQQHRVSSFLLPASRYWITPHPHSNASGHGSSVALLLHAWHPC